MENSYPDDYVDLLCGDRRIVGKEYNTLSMYNNEMCRTEFGIGKLRRLLQKYTLWDSRYEDVLNFVTEENLNMFIWECRTYLRLPVE